ncbi:metallophosphoesterase [Acetivibrio sp. MSJd-27]|uniref:metallophosphoesterase n=1 Tax=Acetivibrio sp. MSJd-27 TaxID=2841523 RepID=UPI001C122343|nr:metallophosphoesterase [Acetivibrio sp. MSJd-27]MBU5449036.1 metallophosphoesterase [Acetivibrio sp. MSJd-27]
MTQDCGKFACVNHVVFDSLMLKNCELPEAVYAVSGNHDKWSGRFDELREKWERDYPVTFLDGKSAVIQRGGQSISVYGIGDPDTWENDEAETYVKKALQKQERIDGYQILLFHRANMLDLFNGETFDLVLSGHMHGGQIRIPFLGGLKSPHGDWFPKYSGGRYEVNGHTYLVSRGIGNAVSVPRIFNRGEIVVQ